MTSIISALFFRAVRNVARAEIDGKIQKKKFFLTMSACRLQIYI